MNENDVSGAVDDDALDEEALEQATGGTAAVGHELAHTVQQQRSGVGANETITVGGNQTISVGTTEKK
jgi:hypothetical protein